MAFKKIIGHQSVISQLKNDVSSGNVAHAYLLSGSSSLGKFTMVKEMAKMLQCENEGCGSCAVCTQIDNGGSLDAEFLPDDGSLFNVVIMRDLVQRILTSHEGKHRIFAIQNIERMNRESVNTFLKVLEEPPPGTVFLMTTGNIGRVLPTVISRVRVLSLFQVSEDELHRGLATIEDERQLNKIIRLAMGKPALAFKMAGDQDFLEKIDSISIKVGRFMGEENLADKFKMIEDICDEAKEDKTLIELFFEVLVYRLREQLLMHPGKSLGDYIETVIDNREALRRNVNARLILENLVI